MHASSLEANSSTTEIFSPLIERVWSLCHTMYWSNNQTMIVTNSTFEGDASPLQVSSKSDQWVELVGPFKVFNFNCSTPFRPVSVCAWVWDKHTQGLSPYRNQICETNQREHLKEKNCSPFLFAAGGAGGAGPGQAGQDVHRRGPPSVHHPKRRPHCRLSGGRGGRTGETSRTAGQEGSLLHSGHHTDGLREGMREQRESDKERERERCSDAILHHFWWFNPYFFQEISLRTSTVYDQPPTIDSFSGAAGDWMACSRALSFPLACLEVWPSDRLASPAKCPNQL